MFDFLNSIHNFFIEVYSKYFYFFIPENLIHWAILILFLLLFSYGVSFIKKRRIIGKLVNAIIVGTSNLKYLYHNYSTFIIEVASSLIIFYFAFRAAESFFVKQKTDLLYGALAVGVALVKALLKSYRIRRGIGKEFETIYNSKLNIGASFNQFNDQYHPYSKIEEIKYKGDIENLISEILFNQLVLIKTLFRPGFSLGGEDQYTVSILFYNPKDRHWHLHSSLCLPGNESAPSAWPISRENFVFDESLYTRKSTRTYNVIEINGEKYESVLQIPLYLRKSYDKTIGLSKGNVYCIISFASKKKQSFQKLKSLSAPVRTLFLPEVLMLEKYLYKLYRFHVNIEA